MDVKGNAFVLFVLPVVYFSVIITGFLAALFYLIEQLTPELHLKIICTGILSTLIIVRCTLSIKKMLTWLHLCNKIRNCCPTYVSKDIDNDCFSICHTNGEIKLYKFLKIYNKPIEKGIVDFNQRMIFIPFDMDIKST